MTTKFKKVAYLADEFKRLSKQSLDKFVKNFAEDPHYAFSWGQDAVRAAAQRHVGEMIETYLTKVRENQPKWTDEQIADCVVNELNEELLRKARWPDHSTSGISNMIAQERTAYLAEFIARIQDK